MEASSQTFSHQCDWHQIDFQKKTDEMGEVIWNKARLVAQGYTLLEGIFFDETFAPVARLESIQLLLAISCHLKIKLYQMDVKSAFLNEFLNKEVYVEQLKGFKTLSILTTCSN